MYTPSDGDWISQARKCEVYQASEARWSIEGVTIASPQNSGHWLGMLKNLLDRLKSSQTRYDAAFAQSLNKDSLATALFGIPKLHSSQSLTATPSIARQRPTSLDYATPSERYRGFKIINQKGNEMNTLFTNEKLGRSVEDLRLREIAQQVERQRYAQDARNAWFKRVGRKLVSPVILLMHLFSR